MADSKITALDNLTSADPANDMIPIVDVSATPPASGNTKRISINNILACSPTATLASATITGDLTVRSGNKLILNRADNAISSQLFDAGGGAGLTVNNLNGDGFLLKVASNNVYQVSSSYVQTWLDGAGGTRMTLNATGLGVGGGPITGAKLDVNGFVRGTSGAVFQGANNITTGSGLELGYSGSYSFLQSFNRTGAAYLPIRLVGSSIDFDIANSVKMTLDASGNLLVAGASAYIRAGGRTQIVGGSVVDINTVGNNVGIAFGGASSILPCDGSSVTTDGVANFGSASKRWNTIYASTGTINTSDQNEKQDIADLGDAEKRVAGKIKSLVKKYRFKDAVASKGENARIHVGWIAQDIQNAFLSEGLDASKYGVFCSDTWEENGVQKTRLGLRYDEVLAFVVSVI